VRCRASRPRCRSRWCCTATATGSTPSGSSRTSKSSSSCAIAALTLTYPDSHSPRLTPTPYRNPDATDPRPPSHPAEEIALIRSPSPIRALCMWRVPGVWQVRLAMTMKSRVLAPGEVAPLRSMYVISRGRVIFGGRVLSPGKARGTSPLFRPRCTDDSRRSDPVVSSPPISSRRRRGATT
jgi:hypothetical protein